MKRLANLDAATRRWLKAEVDRRTRQRLKTQRAQVRREARLWAVEEPPWNRFGEAVWER